MTPTSLAVLAALALHPDQTIGELVQVTGSPMALVAGSVNALNGTGAIRATSVCKPYTWALDMVGAPTSSASARKPRASKPADHDRLPTKAEALAMVARGDYLPPPGVRFEIEAWTLVSTQTVDAAHLDARP